MILTWASVAVIGLPFFEKDNGSGTRLVGISNCHPCAILIVVGRLQDNFLLTTHFNGQPLTHEHGYPRRGVIGAFPDQDEINDP